MWVREMGVPMNAPLQMIIVCAFLAGCANVPVSVPPLGERTPQELMRGVPVLMAPFAAHSDVVTIPVHWQYVLDPTADASSAIPPGTLPATAFFRSTCGSCAPE